MKLVDGGFRVKNTEAERLGSATLVATTLAICWDAMLAGAVKRPVDEMVPEPAGVIDQLTAAVLGVPVTEATNCCALTIRGRPSLPACRLATQTV